jgi:hypothetical protein
MTTDERLDQLTKDLQEFERITRQGFATLTELHGETQRTLQKLANSMSALADHVADHDTRLDKLEGE